MTFQLVGTRLLRRFHTMSCSFRGRRSTLDVSIVILRGSRSTLEVLCYVYSRTRGLRVCSLDVAFTSATVRNRSREDRMAVPMVSSAEVVIFGGFTCLVASFRVAGVALRDIQTFL